MVHLGVGFGIVVIMDVCNFANTSFVFAMNYFYPKNLASFTRTFILDPQKIHMRLAVLELHGQAVSGWLRSACGAF